MTHSEAVDVFWMANQTPRNWKIVNKLNSYRFEVVQSGSCQVFPVLIREEKTASKQIARKCRAAEDATNSIKLAQLKPFQSKHHETVTHQRIMSTWRLLKQLCSLPYNRFEEWLTFLMSKPCIGSTCGHSPDLYLCAAATLQNARSATKIHCPEFILVLSF